MWPFDIKEFTGVYLVIINHLGSTKVLKAYDCGHGAFIKSYLNGDPRYLKADGGFEDNTYTCNGDAVSWKIHKGDKQNLKLRSDYDHSIAGSD